MPYVSFDHQTWKSIITYAIFAKSCDYILWCFVNIGWDKCGVLHVNMPSTVSTFILYVTTVYPKKYAHGFCFAVLCCGYILTDFPISIRLTSLALWQSNDCPSASKATVMNMNKYFTWIHYEWLHNHSKAKHNKTVCIFLGIYCHRVDTNGTEVVLIKAHLLLLSSMMIRRGEDGAIFLSIWQ